MSCSEDGDTGCNLHILAKIVSTSPLLASLSSSSGNNMQLREVEALLPSLFQRHVGLVDGDEESLVI